MASHSDDEELHDDGPPAIEPYETLGISKTATADEIKTAYRKAALKHHPGMSTSPSNSYSSLFRPRTTLFLYRQSSLLITQSSQTTLLTNPKTKSHLIKRRPPIPNSKASSSHTAFSPTPKDVLAMIKQEVLQKVSIPIISTGPNTIKFNLRMLSRTRRSRSSQRRTRVLLRRRMMCYQHIGRGRANGISSMN